MATLLNKILQATGSYIAAINKTLWTGSAWTSGAKSISGISNYKMLYIMCKYSYGYAHINGSTMIYEGTIKYGNNFVTCYITGTLSGDTVTIGNNSYVVHTTSGSHGALGVDEIQSIVGILPDPAKFGLGGVA